MTEDPAIRRAAILRAQAALDQELDAANALQIERDLASDETLRHAIERGRALGEAIRAHLPKEAAPEALRAKVLALAASRAPTAKARFGVRPLRFAALAASLGLALFLTGFLSGRHFAGTDENDDMRPLVDSFARGEIAGQPFDVASSDRHTVKPWLASRAPFGADIPDLGESGYPLAGGRVDLVDRRPAPTLVYRRREHWINVTELPQNDRPEASQDVSRSTISGYHLLAWRDRTRRYVAVSDIEPDELAAFVATFREKMATTQK